MIARNSPIPHSVYAGDTSRLLLIFGVAREGRSKDRRYAYRARGDTIGTGIFLVTSDKARTVGSVSLVFAAWLIRFKSYSTLGTELSVLTIPSGASIEDR
jgi:hypothetical protein